MAEAEAEAKAEAEAEAEAVVMAVAKAVTAVAVGLMPDAAKPSAASLFHLTSHLLAPPPPPTCSSACVVLLLRACCSQLCVCVLTPSSACATACAPQALLAARAGVGFGISGSFTQYTLFMEWLPHRSRGHWLVLFNAWCAPKCSLEPGALRCMVCSPGNRSLHPC